MVDHEARCSGPSERVLGGGNGHIADLGVGLDETDHLSVPRSICGGAVSIGQGFEGHFRFSNPLVDQKWLICWVIEVGEAL